MRRREKLFWLAVGAAFVVGFMALIPAHGEICKESAKTGEEACTSYRLVPFLIIQIGKILDALGVAVTAVATIFIALFTLALRRSTDKLWDAGERQLTAVTEANRISKENLISSRRAWLSIDDVKLIHPTRFAEDGFLLRVEATIKNVGQTPATSMWVNFNGYYSGGDESYAAAKERILTAARNQPRMLGKTVFPHDPFVQREMWGDEKEKVEKSITTRPDGTRKGGVTIFITVSYCIFGDDNRHVTQDAYDLLNIPIGAEVPEDLPINLQAAPFVAGEID